MRVFRYSGTRILFFESGLFREVRMVQDLPEKCVPEVCEKVWQLSQEPYHQFYPIFESEEDVKNTLSWTMEGYGSRAYGYWRARVLEGVCCLFVEDEKHYVLIIALYSWGKFSAAANAFMRQIEKEFPGYTIDAGIAGEHTRFAQKLIRSGFMLQDERYDMRRGLNEVGNLPELEEADLAILEGGSLGEYAALHDAWFPDSGWSAEDLERVRDRWIVVTARRSGETRGAIFVVLFPDQASVNGLRAEDQAMANALLSVAIKRSARRTNQPGTMMGMVQLTDEMQMRAMIELGFVKTAHYTFFQRKAQ